MGVFIGMAIGAVVGAATSYAKGKIAYEHAQKNAKTYVRNGQLVIEKRLLTVKDTASHQKVSFLSSGLLLEGTPRAVINSTLVTGKKDILQQVSNINNRASNYIKSVRHSAISGIWQGTLSGAIAGALTAGAMGAVGGAAGGAAGSAASSVGSAMAEGATSAAVAGTAAEGIATIGMEGLASALTPATTLSLTQMGEIALMTAASSLQAGSFDSGFNSGGFNNGGL